jgi:hypothetical protein
MILLPDGACQIFDQSIAWIRLTQLREKEFVKLGPIRLAVLERGPEVVGDAVDTLRAHPSRSLVD